MQIRFLFRLLLLTLAIEQASAEALPTPAETKAQPATSNSLEAVLVEDEAAIAEGRIRLEAAPLLKKRDYLGLDKMAERLRKSGVTFSDGRWPIWYFYSAVSELPKGSSPSDWEAQMRSLRDWFEHDPASITPRVAFAVALVDYAWEARGSGWASTVSDGGWKLFGERLTEARRILTAAETLGETCPVFYSTQLRVALGDGTPREQYDRLFQESVKAYPTYSAYYLIRARYLLPRWHGTEGEWEAFAATSADKLGGEAGDALYAQMVWDMHDARFFGNIMMETQVNWPRAERGFVTLCRRYPASIAAPSEYCYLSGFAPQGARERMRSLFSQLGNRVDLGVWKTIDRWEKDRRWAFSN